MTTTVIQNKSRVDKAQPGSSWRDKEEHILPKNRVRIVLFGLMCSVFLAALDQTIVATALPTIVAELGGGNNYSWVGSAYMISAGAFGPLYGKLSDMFGRKPILYSSTLVFLFGSAMCGAAQNMTWLILSRAIQGIGGGGIIQLVVIIVSDIIPLKDRGRYSGFVGAMYGGASVLGPLLGGVFAQHVSWRWCFFINLPTGGVSVIILFIFLNLNPHQKRPIRDQLAEVDFIGLFCLVGGTTCLLAGFTFSETTWSNAKTISLLVIGTALVITGGFNVMYTKRSAIIPARLFKTRTTGIILVVSLFNSIVFCVTLYYLPLFYQVLGASATFAGIKVLTFSLGVTFASIVAGSILSKTGKYRPTFWVAYALMTLGTGLMTTLSYTSSIAEQEVFPLIAALGVGCLLQAPLIAIQAAMPLKDMATTSSGFMFIRTIGGALGIALGEAIIASVLPKKLAGIPNFASLGLGTTTAELNGSIGLVHLISNATLRDAVLHAWSQAISTIWLVCTPFAGCALILSLFLREYSLDRKVVRPGEAKTPGDVEEGAEEQPLDEIQPSAEPLQSVSELTTAHTVADSKVPDADEISNCTAIARA